MASSPHALLGSLLAAASASFTPKRSRRGARALLPAELCHRILDLSLWLISPVLALGFLLICLRDPVLGLGSPYCWIMMASSLAMCIAAVCRGLRFEFRFGALVFGLVLMPLLVSILIALAPNWAVLVAILSVLVSLFHGLRLGLLTLVLMVLAQLLILWGWSAGVLPPHASAALVHASHHDIASFSTWLPRLIMAAGLLTCMMLVIHLVLRAYRRSDALARAVMNSVGAHIAVLDASGCILSVNESWQRFGVENSDQTGHLPASAGVGGNYLEVCRRAQGKDQETAKKAHDGILAVLEGRAPAFSMDYSCDSLQEPRWFHMEVTPLLGSSERHAVISHHNVTDRRKAQQLLHDSSARFAALFYHSPIGMVMTRLESGLILDLNQAFASMHGYQREELVGRTSLEIGMWWDEEQRARVVRDLKERGRCSDIRIQTRTLAGEHRLLLLSAELLEYEHEQFVISFVRDVTEEQQMRETLRQRETLIEEVGQIANIGGWDFDPVSLSGKWTEELVRMHDLEPGAPIDVRKGLDFFAPGSRAEMEEVIRRVMEEHKPFDTETELITAKGVHKWVRTIGQPVLRDGKLVRVRGTMQDVTALHLARQALLESEYDFRSIFELSSLGMAQAEAKTGTFLRVNRRMTQIVGRSESELLGRTFFEFTHPEDRSSNGELLRALAEGRIGEFHVEKRFIRKDGSVVWANVHVVLARNRSRSESITISTIEDITDRKRTEEALLEYRRILDAALSSMTDAVLIADSSGRFVHQNGAFARFHRYVSLDECPKTLADYQTVFEIVQESGEVVPFESWPMSRAMRGETGVNAEYLLLRTDIRESWIGSYSYSPIRDREGQIMGVVIVMRDITERRHADAARLESEARLRLLGDNLPDSYVYEYTHDEGKKHHFLYLSAGVERLHGVSAEAILADADALRRQIDAAQLPAMLAAEAESARGMKDFEMDLRMLHVDGKWRWIHVRSRPRRRNNGQVIWDGVATDITERRQLEEQVLRAQRMDAIGTLSSGIAHDLNNILAPMLMASSVLGSLLQDEKDRELLLMIENSAKRGADIIRQLLTFSRGVEGRRVRLQIRHLIREMVGIARETFPRDIRIQEKVDRDVWPIVADATQIHQILLNLCVNARDAMPDGGELRIEARNVTLEAEEARRMPRAHPGPHVLLCVHDSGMGIAKENIDRIFEPFFTTKELGKGTGLGLSTVLGILRSHGGTVSVYSEPGRGTVFNIYLPADPEGGETAGADGEHERLTRGHGQTILVVDDEEPMRLVAKRALESNGYKVITAPNGQEAMRLFILNQSEIRLVLTDMMMPVMDGLKLARALRVLDEQLPILASSGLDFAEKTKGMEEGLIMDFLSKPYDVPILLKVIQQQLSSDHKG